MRVWCKQKILKQSQYWIPVWHALDVNFCHVMSLIDLVISCNIVDISWIFSFAPTHKADSWDKKVSPSFRSLDWRLASSPPMILKTSVSNKSLLRSEPEVPPICFTVASPSAICRETWNQQKVWSMMHNRFTTLSFKSTGRRSWVCKRMICLQAKLHDGQKESFWNQVQDTCPRYSTEM